MRRGYLKGLILGGIVGLAIGKMLKYRENIDHQWEDGSDRSNNDQNSYYEKQFAPFIDDEGIIEDGEIVKENNNNEIIQDEDFESKRIARRKKPARVSLNKRKKIGSLDE